MLRAALIANLFFSAVCGAVMLANPDWLGTHIPLPGWFWFLAGSGLCLFALQLAAMAARETWARALTPYVIGMDWGWVVLTSTGISVIWEKLTSTGGLLVLVTNLAVALLATWQQSAYKTHYSSFGHPARKNASESPR